MDRAEEELEQLASWLSEEGLAPDSPKEDQLCLLWSTLQRTRGRLNSVTWDLDSQRSQHLAEMAEVRKSLEQIRILTEHKDVLAQEIQDENDQLKDQLQRLVSLQDSQISEVAKMLYQQGLTDLIHSSPSEQVAYLLVERASLLEEPNNLTADGNTAGRLGTEELNISAQQLTHKGAPRHGHSPWKRLFGLHKAAQSKHTFIPDEARHLAGEANSVERECYRLERDLEEGSRRLAMAHSEIRRLTDELESAHLTQRAYEPELQAAQQEVEQLRKEVQKLKKYEMVELRKAKEMNDRLDLEIRALRSRVRTLDAEKTSMQQMVVSLQKKVEQLESQLTEQVQTDQTTELTDVASLRGEVKLQVQANEAAQDCQVVSLQREVERLESALQEQQQLLLTEQVQANELAKSQEAELIQKNIICRDLQTKLSAQSRSLIEMESEINSLKQLLDTSCHDLDNLYATQENNVQDQKNQEEQHSENCQLKCDSEPQTQLQPNEENTLCKEVPDYQEAVKSLLATQHECETLKKEICETLKCLDKERSKYHELKEKHKVKLCRAKQRCDDETTWRDEKIKNLERELSLCSHSVAKEKELTISITMENEKLLRERRRLLEQLKEEEHNKKDCNLTAALCKCRVDFLEMENKKLGNKIIHISNQLAVLERSRQNTQTVHFSEELKKTSNFMQVFKSLPVQTSSVTMPELSEIQGLLDNAQRKQTDVTSSLHGFISGPPPPLAETGYLNLTSAQTLSDPSAPLSNSDSTCS